MEKDLAMTRLSRWSAVVLLTTASAACAPMTVSSHVERGLDITRYHTFEWGTADALPQGDPRLDRNPFFKDHFEGAVEKQLAARGLEHSGASPDLLIHYHATIAHRLEIDHTSSTGYCPTRDCDPPLVGFEAGTLILDFIDANQGVHKGEAVVTSGWHAEGIASHFPANLPIGEVTSASIVEQEASQQIRLRPYADMANLDIVQVLTGGERE